MTRIGDQPKRVDIKSTKGLKFSRPLTVSVSGVQQTLTGHTFTCKIRKTYSSTTSYNCTFTLQPDQLSTILELPASISQNIPIGADENDPASKYVYDVHWTPPGGSPKNIMYGTWVFIPGSSNV